MPYSPKQKRDTREKILESARRQRGGEAVKTAYQEVVEQMVKVFEDH